MLKINMAKNQLAGGVLHLKVRQLIRNYLNEHQPEYLPSERQLQQELNVSRTTLRKALKELVLENRIMPVHGKGYRVLSSGAEALIGRIGLAVRAHAPAYEVMIFDYIADQIYNIGFQPVIMVVDSRYDAAVEKLAGLLAKTDGIIVASSLLNQLELRIALMNAPYRCIAVPYPVSPQGQFSSVTAATAKGSETLAGLLLDNGHRKIVLMTDSRDQSRVAGVEEAFRKRKLSFSKEFFFSCRGYRHFGYEQFGNVLKSGLEFTAVICQNDACALGVMEHCMKENLDVPGKVSIVGFGNIPDAAQLPVPLTTVEIDPDLMAKMALDKLLDGIKTKKIQIPAEIPTRLIERSSVKSLAAFG
ncbi:MAG: GntR family transcriptional regulator [Victivallales bacterium]|nr:GntR family transcriptional regulator [Victivallales bacterium]